MRLFISLTLLLFRVSLLQAQGLDSTLMQYASAFPQERIHIQFDRGAYIPGDTIWFKSYLLDGILPADQSKSFYVDWTDDTGNVLAHQVFPIADAGAAGQFKIPVFFKGNVIHVNAYTKWMLNFDSAFLFNRDIPVRQKRYTSTKPPESVTTLSFFPEGGDLCLNLTNKVAFKANDQWGRPQFIQGAIYNSQGEFIDTIRVQHDGMGAFFIKPSANESYTVYWKDATGNMHQSSLPEARRHGIAVQVKPSAHARRVLLQAGAGVFDSVHLVGTMNQQPVFHTSKNMRSGHAEVLVNVEHLASGIMVITIFDTHWTALAERIIFVNNKDYELPVRVETLQTSQHPKGKNEISVSLPDSISANLSISITSEKILPDTTEGIISQLLLSSELRGKINDPAYYFRNKSDSATQALDLIMLTHGWRRFNWNDITTGRFPQILYPRDTSYFTISGKIIGPTAEQLRNAVGIVLITKPAHGPRKVLSVPINADGTFEDRNTLLIDSTGIFYQLSNAKGMQHAKVKFTDHILRAPVIGMKATTAWFDLNKSITNAMSSVKTNIGSNVLDAEGQELSNVTVAAKTKSAIELLDEKYASDMFDGPTQQVDVIHDPRKISASSIIAYLENNIRGLNVSIHPPLLVWHNGIPDIYIDDIEVEAERLSHVSVADVAYVKAISPPVFGYKMHSAGVIALYTRHGDDLQSFNRNGEGESKIAGYTVSREFYSPNYEDGTAPTTKIDTRATLYWNAQLQFAEGKLAEQIIFFNNDVPGDFRITIEGLTSDGRLIQFSKPFHTN